MFLGLSPATPCVLSKLKISKCNSLPYQANAMAGNETDVPDFVVYILHTTHGSGGSLYQIMAKSNTRVLHQQPSKAQKKG
ncbi:hypothetical protein ACFX13_012518 [Malus domestica]